MNDTVTVMMPTADGRWLARAQALPTLSQSERRRFERQKRELYQLHVKLLILQQVQPDDLSLPDGAALPDDIKAVQDEIAELKSRMPTGDALALLHEDCLFYSY
jgi:hypothetical protein